MNLKIIMLSESSQTKKEKTHGVRFHLYNILKIAH